MPETLRPLFAEQSYLRFVPYAPKTRHRLQHILYRVWRRAVIWQAKTHHIHRGLMKSCNFAELRYLLTFSLILLFTLF